MSRRKHRDKSKSLIREYLEAIGLAILLALIIRTWGLQAFKIPSESMKPTLLIGDHLLVFKSAYDIKLPFSDRILLRVGEPKRGDVVVFVYPENRDMDFIKRIIGLPGETVEVKDQTVLVNGKPIEDPWGHYLPTYNGYHQCPHPDHFGPVTVPPDQYFVMGDNRNESKDSRYWFDCQGGFVPRADLIGRAVIIYWAWQDESWSVRWSRLLTLLTD